METEKTLGRQEPEKFFQRLLNTLQEQNSALLRLKANLQAQYELLLSGRMKNFLPLLEEQQALLWEVEGCEEVRKHLVAEQGPGQADLTLNELTALAPAGVAEDLRRLQKELQDRVFDIQQFRERNRHLIQKSLELIHREIAAIEQLVRIGYDESGKAEQPKASTINRRI